MNKAELRKQMQADLQNFLSEGREVLRLAAYPVTPQRHAPAPKVHNLRDEEYRRWLAKMESSHAAR